MILVDELNLAEDAVLERLNRWVVGRGSKTAWGCRFCAALLCWPVLAGLHCAVLQVIQLRLTWFPTSCSRLLTLLLLQCA